LFRDYAVIIDFFFDLIFVVVWSGNIFELES
jgi:hypothetical protein